MGVGLETWRQRIGSFSQLGAFYCGAVHLSGIARYSRVTPRLACVIVLLLIISGVELNPGPAPKMDDFVQRLDDLFRELRDTRTTLLAKIDDSARDLTLRLQHCETLVTSFTTRLSDVERSRDTMAGQIAALQASIATINITAPHAASAAPASRVEISDVMHELDMRASKKANIVLSGLQPSSRLTDVAIVTSLLRDELSINATVVSCTRLGKPSADVNRPCRILATLSSVTDSLAAVRNAKKLRTSTEAHVREHVFVNADLTPEQRKQDYNLRTELKRRRAAGELNLVIRNGKLHTKAARPAAGGNA